MLVSDQIVNIVTKDRIDFINQNSTTNKLILLDGFPRSLEQCDYLYNLTSGTSLALRIDLARWVIVKKLLGRRKCIHCQQDFNVCDIRTDGYDMPPILPNSANCPLNPCNPQLVSRDDDTEDIIEARLQDYEDRISSITAYFVKMNAFSSFQVRRGIADTDNLIKLIESIFEFHKE